ncbi:hypothetical protein V8F06_000435 [Rhypophila decipiens]
MAKDRDSDVSDTNQSQRPGLNHLDSNASQSSVLYSQQQNQQNQQSQTVQQQPSARVKSQKHVVGGVARLHARVPSSKALHKHHASASSSKLNRRQGSPSPERAPGYPVAPTHRRATSDQKIPKEAASTNLKKNSSHTALKRNKSQLEFGKKSKSSSNLKRSLSNPAVNKVKASGGSKVHFNLGDDQDEYDDNNAEDEWVDASASASPLLSRRGSTISGVETNNNNPMSQDDLHAPPSQSQAQAQPEHDNTTTNQVPSNGANGTLSRSLGRDRASHKEYITSRILQRNPSHGAPPKMSAENVSVRPASSRAHSPDGAISTLSSTPVLASMVRPGSSGKEELTSRFVGNSQDTKSSMPGSSFIIAQTRNGGPSRSAPNGNIVTGTSERPRSVFESVVQTQAQLHQEEQIKAQRRRARRTSLDNQEATDDEEDPLNGYAAEAKSRHWGPYGLVRDINRTQQKLNLQRASSTLETTHPHPGVGIGLDAIAAVAGPLIGGANYDVPRDPRVGKMLERTGMEYLVVRRYQNPVARSLTRLARITGADKGQRISRPGTAHSRGPSIGKAASIHNGVTGGQNNRRPPTPRRTLSSFRPNMSASSSLENDGGGPSRMHERQVNRLSGASLVDGEEDAGTMALLRNMWDKNLDLSASQD